MQNSNNAQVQYKTVTVDGLTIFYREAGSPAAPTLLLLHGYPTSSHMFRDLIPRLADRYHVVAPDYPGFGYSSMPDRKEFAYTFTNLTRAVEHFTDALQLDKYILYVMDYGAPIGYRLALLHPERVQALVVQNGNAYEEGLGDFWIPLKKLWQEPTEANGEALRDFTKADVTKRQYTHGVSDTTLISPDAWTLDQIGLDRPGNYEIQLDLFYDYRTNVPLYPEFQAFFRRYQSPTLVAWGKNDMIFPPEGAAPYIRDLPKAEIHLLDAGHFALETHGPEIAGLMRDFLNRNGI